MRKITMKYFAVFGCLFMALGNAGAQDMHYSQYNYDPLALNPALAGLVNCDYRLALNARTQWNTVSSSGNTYSTFGASADFAVGKVTKFASFAGIGVSLNSDISGATFYNTNLANICAAYHFMLDRRGNSSLSFGLNFGVAERGFNASKITTDAQYNTLINQYDGSLPTKEDFARSTMVYLNAGLGAFYNQYFHQHRENFYFGISVDHVNEPNISWYSSGLYNNSGDDKLYVKTTIHGGGSIEVGRKTWIMPNAMILLQGTSQEYDFGSLVKWKIGNSISTTFFYLGAQYRAPFDAVILQTRIDYKGINVGFSYDINISKLVPASQTMGAPELSIIYQGCFNPPPAHRGMARPFMCPSM